jgi:hypothetical protein
MYEHRIGAEVLRLDNAQDGCLTEPQRPAARSARCEGNHIQDRAAADDVLGIADLDPLCGISEIGGADR